MNCNPSAYLAQLTLTQYRNYDTLRLDLSGAPVVLVGQNGAGKTNVLEAISMLTPGRGLRHATLGELDRRAEEGARPWAVAAHLATPHGPLALGTGREGETRERRSVLIAGRRVRGQAELAEHVSALWLTPQQDQVLFEGGSARRRFLDRLVYGFDPVHATRVAAYETAMRERNRLLKPGRDGRASFDPEWLTALESTMAAQTVAIASARAEAMARIGDAILQGPPEFPRARIALTGTAEEALATGQPALAVGDELRAMFLAARARDGASGRTGMGAHRSGWQVWHPNTREAAQCSTGEQKAMLLSILLAQARAAAGWGSRVPLLLLDEVVAHLDEARRAALFEQIRHLRVQAWLTGTELALFKGILSHGQVFEAAFGAVRAAA